MLLSAVHLAGWELRPTSVHQLSITCHPSPILLWFRVNGSHRSITTQGPTSSREISKRPGVDIFHKVRTMASKQIAHVHYLLVPGEVYREDMAPLSRLTQVHIEVVIDEGEEAHDRL